MSHDNTQQLQQLRVRLSAELNRLRERNRYRRHLQILKDRAQNRGMSGLVCAILGKLLLLWQNEEQSRLMVIKLFFRLNLPSLIELATHIAYRFGESGSGNAEDAVQQAILAFLSNPALDFGRIRGPITPETCEDGLWRFLGFTALDLAREAQKKDLRQVGLRIARSRDLERSPPPALDLMNGPIERFNRILWAAPPKDALRLTRIHRQFCDPNARHTIGKADRRWLRRLPTKPWFPR